jgi:hypothetical protein
MFENRREIGFSFCQNCIGDFFTQNGKSVDEAFGTKEFNGSSESGSGVWESWGGSIELIEGRALSATHEDLSAEKDSGAHLVTSFLIGFLFLDGVAENVKLVLVEAQVETVGVGHENLIGADRKSGGRLDMGG